MTTKKESDILTQTGPGTPLGELMREYWLPAIKSSELEADGDPLRFMLLSEKLIAFRDTSGRVGVMDHRCPHRCASFFFGRNEENGITCTYHGWKFDVDGNCVDMPNVPAHQDFKKKVPAKAYKAAERNGLIYVYMGKKKPPALPDIEACLLPEDEIDLTMVHRECNWLQAAEGELDTSHVGFLHFGAAQQGDFDRDDMSQYIAAHRQPLLYTKDTDYGVTYAGHRPGDEGQSYWRIAHFLFPCWTMPPIMHIDRNIRTRAYVPIDDQNSMVVVIEKKRPKSTDRSAPDPWFAGASQNYRYLPRTTDWFGRYRRMDNATNDYNINRDLQRAGVSYTGIDGIQLQDQALQESMGAVTDHTFERLSPSDQMITQVRRRIIRAARAFAKSGALPKNARSAKAFDGVRGGHFQAREGIKWEKAYRDQLKAFPLSIPKAIPKARAAE